MKYVLLALVGLAACYAFAVPKNVATQLSGEELSAYVNKAQNLWVAEHNAEMTEDKMHSIIMDSKYTVMPAGVPEALEIQTSASIPASFDSRTHWSQCATIKHIRDQSDCGSCWAFAAAEVISDRTCIASNNANSPVISSEDILSCCGNKCGDGCEGGYPIEAMRYWNSKGVPTGGDYGDTHTCKPYVFAPCGGDYPECPKQEYKTPSCSTSCISQYTAHTYTSDKHYGKSAYGVGRTVAAIQKEIMTYGPVEAAFTVYEDFYQYKSGVYVHTGGKELGGHAVKIIGWGTDGSTPYWLIANSWNTAWGEKGFFRMIRGANECGIEQAIVAGLPK